MFKFLCRNNHKAPDETPKTTTVEIEVEDLTVMFRLHNGTKLYKDFISSAWYQPMVAHRDDGIAIADAADRAQHFMRQWQQNQWASIGDAIARFDDFAGATITRNKRTIRVKARSGEATA